LRHGRLGLRTVRLAVICAIPVAAVCSQASARERTISLYNIHTKETLTVTYRRNGTFMPEAMKKINWHLRDWRRDSATEMDPELIDLAWEIHAELGSREPIHIISGYRSPATNTMLRQTRGGQARRSQHTLGRALDMHFPDVSIRRLRYSALIRERGGVGYYPTSAIPFVHIDTARVRHWPRMQREELALLFPSGRTRHYPSGGGPITIADVHRAKRERPDLHRQIAMFRDERHPPTAARTRVAAARPPVIPPFETSVAATIVPPEPRRILPPPVLTAPPRLAQRSVPTPPAPSKPAPPSGPDASDRLSLASLAALASASFFEATTTGSAERTRSGARGRALASARLSPDAGRRPALSRVTQAWARAPSYDDEHPEELSYRPFPIAPLLSDGMDREHPLLTSMVQPDPVRTIELMDEAGDLPSLHLRPGRQTVAALWSHSFSGRAIELQVLLSARQPRKREPAPPQAGEPPREILSAAAR
jgi:uncharacterized protein YcbK (DUF882 family)